MAHLYTHAEVMDMLNDFVDSFDTQKEAAVAIGVSAGYLSKVLNGEKPIGKSKKILKALSLDPKLYYETMDEK